MFDGGKLFNGEIVCHTPVGRAEAYTADRASSDIFDLAAQKHQQQNQNDT